MNLFHMGEMDITDFKGELGFMEMGTTAYLAVSSKSVSTTPNDTSASAKSCMVHALQPSGGLEHASVTRCASAKTSSFLS